MTNLIPVKDNVRNRWLDSIFEDFFSSPSVFDRRGVGLFPRVNVIDDDDHFVFEFEIPGVEKKDIGVTITNNILSVSGERQSRKKSDKDRYIREELLTGSFERQFTLPDSVKSDSIKAEYKNGILEVRLDKKEEVKPKQIEVKVS
ncbi:MAG: Hsp20/alpha crystallin family protein [Candidatus Zixiibacteriota bacterium]|nr:MAG: Hsp20/alpha crystallin family protein [candidate division Zixibacteria bacterium]